MQAVLNPSGGAAPQTAVAAAAKAPTERESGGFRNLVNNPEKRSPDGARGEEEKKAVSETLNDVNSEEAAAERDAEASALERETGAQTDTRRTEKTEAGFRWPMGLGALNDGAEAPGDGEPVDHQSTKENGELQNDRIARSNGNATDPTGFDRKSVGDTSRDILGLQKAVSGMQMSDEAPGPELSSRVKSDSTADSSVKHSHLVVEAEANTHSTERAPAALAAVLTSLSKTKTGTKDGADRSELTDLKPVVPSLGAKDAAGQRDAVENEKVNNRGRLSSQIGNRDAMLSSSTDFYASRDPIDIGSAKPAVVSPGMADAAPGRALQALSQTGQSLIDVVQENSNWTRHLSAPTMQISEAARSEGSILQSLKIQLNPVELGQVELRLRMVQGQMQVDIRVQNDQAYQVLTQDQEALAGVMRGLGYRVDAVSVSTPGAELSNGQAFSNPDSRETSGESSQRRQTGRSESDGNGEAYHAEGLDDREHRAASGDYI